MPVKIEKASSNQDSGTGEATKIGLTTVTVAGDFEEPTGEAKTTLNRNVVMEEHKGTPTGEAEPQRSVTVTTDWPTESKAEESGPKKTTAKKTTRRKSE